MRNLLMLALCAAGLCLSGYAQAADGDDGNKDTYRYDVILIEGKPFRFDKKTGDMVPLHPTGAPKVKESESKQTGASVAEASPPKPRNGRPILVGVDNAVGAEEFVPLEITDTHRDQASSDLAAYREQIGITSILDISGDRLKGTILTTNKGDKRLLALELCISMKDGSGNPVTHHVLMGPHKGSELPPQPPRKEGADGSKSWLKIDLPAPVGLRGKIDVKASYLKFDEH